MSKKNKSIAIIGSGITGLSASWLLNQDYDITLFEKNDHLGGHTHTHDIAENDDTLAIDSGFIVYNEKNYPNLVGLFNQLGVKTQATEMSFAMSVNLGELEYSGSGINGMFAQRSNLISFKHWRLLKEIVRFNKLAHAELAKLRINNTHSNELSLGDFLLQNNFSKDLQQNYLLPMGAAIWSCPVDTMNSFPAHSFLRFFENHGLIDLKNRPQWRTVLGGSREYIRKMMPTLESNITFKAGAESVSRDLSKNLGGVRITCEGENHVFDQVLFACHADEALALLNDPSPLETELLSCFNYEKNVTYLHTDKSLMPKRESVWSAWNYTATTNDSKTSDNTTIDQSTENLVTVTYWMNLLQKLTAKKDYFVTLNPFTPIDPKKIIKKMTYHHPVFTRNAINAQPRLVDLQGVNNSWFCGSYAGYGFHEDGLSSSVAVCELLGVVAPWNQANTNTSNDIRQSG